MKYKQLGNTGVFVSRICLGAMTFGGRDTPPFDKVGGLDQTETQAIVDAALDAGVNFIDTANVYSAGESETLLGEAIKAKRNDIVLATKFHARMGPGPNQVGQSRLHLTEALEASLKRLQTDRIDLYQIHSFDPVTPIEETLRTLEDAVRQGKVRYIGCSNLAAWQIMKALAIADRRNLAPFVSVQAYYSLAGRDLEHDLIPLIEDQKLGLMVWSPLAGGFLSGKYDRNSEYGASRRDKIEFPPIDREKTFDIIDTLKIVGERHGVGAARIALAWIFANPAVTSIIVGARRVDQLTDNLGALDVTLTQQDLEELNAVSDTGPHYPGWLQAGGMSQRVPADT
ncbi:MULTISPECIES: aldo/keto reductase [Agrobacterium]|uniref:aldo/keto reductase n=1 Tax=Agrobacterium tumefaciens TaxID=358 RepID=UPI000EF18F16|nr:aldo/keto reductase [Agrobacterium tumefaciens]NSY09814.1 aldo/keto reductase [Agrobacterium tumefaciens]NSY93329.1 aldo/keto reductase [Agrobacterium tumefaciens]